MEKEKNQSILIDLNEPLLFIFYAFLFLIDYDIIFSGNIIMQFNFKKFYGLYTKQLRKIYEIKQIDLANAIHISRSTLSKMESNAQEMDSYLFEDILQFVHTIDPSFVFLKDKEILQEYDQWVHECAYHFVHLTTEEILDPLKAFLSRSDSNGFGYFHHRLLSVYVMKFENRKCEHEIIKLYESNFFTEPFYQIILNDFMSMRPSLSVDAAMYYLRLAQGYCSIAHDPGLYGLILYHQIYRLANAYRTIEAYELIESCENAFQKAGAYRRMLYVTLNKGILLFQMHIYSRAIATFDELLRSGQQIHNKSDFLCAIYDNLAWCYFLLEQDEKAMEYAKLALKEGSEFPDIYIVLAYSSYRLKNETICLDYISDFLKKSHLNARGRFIASFLQLLRFRLTDSVHFEKQQQQIEQQLPNFKSVQLEIPFYKVLVEYYSEKSQLEQVILYQEKLIHYLKFDF